MAKPTLASRITIEHLRALEDDPSRGFWEDVDVRENVYDCWEWTRGASNYYGRVNVPGYITGEGRPIMLLAHRVALTLHLGALIPAGMQVDHVCRNTLCCNPHHLRVVTARENGLHRRLTAQDYRETATWGLSPAELVHHRRVRVHELPPAGAC